MYNVTLRCFHETIVAMVKQYRTYSCVCVCVHGRWRVLARV